MEKKGSLAVITANCIFGFSFLFSRLAMDVTTPEILIAIRFTAAFLLLNVIVFLGRRLKKPDGTPRIAFSLKGKPKKDLLLMAIFQPIIYFAAENYGIYFTSTAFSGIIIATVPLAGIMFDVLMMHQPASKRSILYALLSVAGVALTTIGAKDLNSSFVGIVLLLIAVASGALFFVYSKRAGSYYNPLERTYFMFGCGSAVYMLVVLVRCALTGWQPLIGALGSSQFWIAVGYLAFLSSVMAFLLLNFGSSNISVSRCTLYANIITVISIVAGVVLLHESFTWLQVAGAAVILFSVYQAQREPK